MKKKPKRWNGIGGRNKPKNKILPIKLMKDKIKYETLGM